METVTTKEGDASWVDEAFIPEGPASAEAAASSSLGKMFLTDGCALFRSKPPRNFQMQIIVKHTFHLWPSRFHALGPEAGLKLYTQKGGRRGIVVGVFLVLDPRRELALLDTRVHVTVVPLPRQLHLYCRRSGRMRLTCNERLGKKPISQKEMAAILPFCFI